MHSDEQKPPNLARINSLPVQDAHAQFLACCGSTTWAQRMTGRRPFESVEEVHAAAADLLAGLSESDWKEAFAAHPRIGETRGASKWSAQEQAGVNVAERDTLAELTELNRVYFEKFGYIYIVCATGKTAAEMLALLKQRLGNDAEKELLVAAAEQAKITHLRLDKMLQ